jgi:hypothetical protein
MLFFGSTKNIKVTVECHFKGMLNLGDTQNLTIAKLIRGQEPFRMFIWQILKFNNKLRIILKSSNELAL